MASRNASRKARRRNRVRLDDAAMVTAGTATTEVAVTVFPQTPPQVRAPETAVATAHAATPAPPPGPPRKPKRMPNTFMVGDILSFRRELYPSQGDRRYLEGTKVRVEKIRSCTDPSGFAVAPGSANARQEDLFMCIVLEGSYAGSVYTFNCNDLYFKIVQEYDPNAPPPPKLRAKDLILPMPRDACELVVQLKPTPRIIAKFAPQDKTTTVQLSTIPVHKVDLRTPPLALSMELAFNGVGGLNMASVGGAGFHLNAISEVDKDCMAPWQWANVHPNGVVCWGANNPAPTSMRAAWASFWDFPTNEHLAPAGVARGHAANCEKVVHNCEKSRTGRPCQRKHVASHPRGEAAAHHSCANYAAGKRCGNHRFPRLEWTPVDVVSLNRAIRACEAGNHHIGAAERSDSVFASYFGGAVRCYCWCCNGRNGEEWRTYSQGTQCGCPKPEDAIEAQMAWDCPCCNRFCRCDKNCRCCAGICRCPLECQCCAGACRCNQRDCTCGFQEKFDERLRTYRPETYQNVRAWAYGTHHVVFKGADAVFLSDRQETLAKVDAKFRHDDGMLVGTAVRALIDGRAFWRVRLIAPDGSDGVFEFERESVTLCV